MHFKSANERQSHTSLQIPLTEIVDLCAVHIMAGKKESPKDELASTDETISLITDIWSCICMGDHRRLQSTINNNRDTFKKTVGQTFFKVKKPVLRDDDKGEWGFLRLAIYLDDAEAVRILLEAGEDPMGQGAIQEMDFMSHLRKSYMALDMKKHQFTSYLSYAVMVGGLGPSKRC